MIDLSTQRFYGAKSADIDSAEVVATHEVGDFTWQLIDATHGSVAERYQVLVDESERDVLGTDAGATAYLAGLAQLGEVHGEMGGERAVAMGAEQSNTSLIVDETCVLKAFRKLERGLNPDVELLSRIGDCPHVAKVRGYLTRDGATLAMQQELIHGGEDGFDLAVADRLGDPGELGAAIRVVHEALADACGTERVEGSHIRESLNSHLNELVERAEPLKAYEAKIRELYRAIPDSACEIQRIHGDLHLGQTLKTTRSDSPRWYLIDFEGEPARPLDQRVAPDHALRDLAGMARSFGYARAVGQRDASWEKTAVEKLLAGYRISPSAILAAYIVDKAAYEVVYEANNRPDWVDIPLQAISDLV